MTITFASFVVQKRLEANLTLRNFCKAAKIDPSNWSKVEREISKPPHSLEILQQIARILNIDLESEDFNTLKELAVISAIPSGLVEENVINQLPVFFRTLRGATSTNEDLDRLVGKIRSAWTPEK